MSAKLIVALIATLFLATSYPSVAFAKKPTHHRIEKGQAHDGLGHLYRNNDECWACNVDI